MITALLVAMAAEPGVDGGALTTIPLDADLRDGLFVERPGAMNAGESFGGALLVYNRRPSPELGLNDLIGVDLSLGAVLHKRLRIDLFAPLVIANTDAAGSWGPTIGDVRMRTLFNLFAPGQVISGGGGAGLGVVGALSVPSGPIWRDLGWGKPSGSVKLAGTWEVNSITLSADAGVEQRPTSPTSNSGGTVGLAGFGAGLSFADHAALHAEATLRSPLGGDLGADLALSLRLPHLIVGGSVGLTNTTGTPDFRLFVGVPFSSVSTRHASGPIDIDSEGTLTIRDACPLESETLNGYRDDDGCPDALGPLSVEVTWRDQAMSAEVLLVHAETERRESITAEGLLIDAIPGDVWSAEATAPCLSGRSSTIAKEAGAVLRVELQPDRPRALRVLIRDAHGTPTDASVYLQTSGPAACIPDASLAIGARGNTVHLGPGEHTLTASAPGLGSVTVPVPPDASLLDLTLVADPITLDGQLLRTAKPITFNDGKLTPAAFEPLDEVAAYLRTHPGVFEIRSHTDNAMPEAVQLRRSRTRAAVVRAYLIGKGVDSARLQPIGYGPTRPIDTNRTPTGRARNDRVEFARVEAP